MQKPTTGKPRGATTTPRAPRAPKKAKTGMTRPVMIAIIAGIVVLAVGGTILGIALKNGASNGQIAENLKRADYYAGKGEFQEALNILNTLSIDDPRVKAALDDVLARKKAADDAAKQTELDALKAQQDQLKAGPCPAGQQPQRATTAAADRRAAAGQAPQEDATAKEKALQKQVQDLLQKGATAFNAGRYAEARKDFEQAAGLAPDNSDALAYTGTLLSPGESRQRCKCAEGGGLLEQGHRQESRQLAAPQDTRRDLR